MKAQGVGGAKLRWHGRIRARLSFSGGDTMTTFEVMRVKEPILSVSRLRGEGFGILENGVRMVLGDVNIFAPLTRGPLRSDRGDSVPAQPDSRVGARGEDEGQSHRCSHGAAA